jgi:tape measure domain-containing protein
MALRELVTVLRYELQQGNLRKYVDGYKAAEKQVNAVAKVAVGRLNAALGGGNVEAAKLRSAVAATSPVMQNLAAQARALQANIGQANQPAARLLRGFGRLKHEVREFSIGLRQGARQGYGEVLRQMDRVEAKQRRLGKSAAAGERMGRGGGMVQGAVQTAVATLSGKKLMDAADTWATTKAQIALQNKSPEDQKRSQDYLFKKAQEQGQDYSTSVGTYTRIARNRESLGLSNDQTLQLTSTLGGMLSLGGGSADSQQAALEQFGQAMGSGELRGDELNSVLEQAPVLANAIAKAFGITSDQLREVAKEGKLTAKGIAQGLLGQTKEVDDALKTLPMTFGRSFTQIRNQFTKRAGELNEKFQLAEKFNRVAQVAIAHLDKIGAALAAIVASSIVAKVFGPLSKAFGFLARSGRVAMLFFDRLGKGKTAQAFAKLGTGGLRFLRVVRGIGAAMSVIGAVGAVAFAAIAAAAIAVGLVVYKYWEPIKAFLTGVWEGMSDAGSAAFDELIKAFEPLNPAFEVIGGWLQAIWDWFLQLIDPVRSTSDELESATSIGKMFGELLFTNLRLVIGVVGLVVKAFVWLGEAIGTALGWLVVSAGEMWDGIKSGVGALWDWITAKFQAGWDFVSGLIPDWAISGFKVDTPSSKQPNNWQSMDAASVVNAGRPAVSQNVTNTATVQVTAPAGANAAAYGAAAQRGTSKAMSGFQYQLPTPVESF